MDGEKQLLFFPFSLKKAGVFIPTMQTTNSLIRMLVEANLALSLKAETRLTVTELYNPGSFYFTFRTSDPVNVYQTEFTLRSSPWRLKRLHKKKFYFLRPVNRPWCVELAQFPFNCSNVTQYTMEAANCNSIEITLENTNIYTTLGYLIF